MQNERAYQAQFRQKKADDIVSGIVAAFLASGIKYTCRAVINDFSRDRVTAALTDVPGPMIEARPALFKPRRLMTRIADDVHKKWQEGKA